MPFALVTVGLLLLVIGAKGTYQQFGSQLYGDLFGTRGQAGFIYWILAIIAIGLLGYAPKLKPLSHAFLILIFIVILLANKGVVQNFISAIRQGPLPIPPIPLPDWAKPSPSGVAPQQAPAAPGYNPLPGMFGNPIGPSSTSELETGLELAAVA